MTPSSHLKPVWLALSARVKEVRDACDWERVADECAVSRRVGQLESAEHVGEAPGPTVELSMTRGLALNTGLLRNAPVLVGLVRLHPALGPSRLRLVVGGRLTGGVVSLGPEPGAFVFAHDDKFVVPYACMAVSRCMYIDADTKVAAACMTNEEDVSPADVDASIGVVGAQVSDVVRLALVNQGARTEHGGTMYKSGGIVVDGSGWDACVVLPDMALLLGAPHPSRHSC
jgi:hypothetical protein